jgi:CHAT domain-containing protein/predicted negative regulator of RcsB-dependent stress response
VSVNELCRRPDALAITRGFALDGFVLEGSRSVLGRALVVLALLSVTLSLQATPQSDPELAALRTQVAHARSPQQQVQALWALSDSLIDRGDLLEAERSLRLAGANSRDAAQEHGTAIRLGAALTMTGSVDEARTLLQSVDVASASLSPDDLLRLRQAEGDLAVRNGDFAAAAKDFEAEAEAAHAMGATSAEVRARINSQRARLDQKNIAGLEQNLQSLYSLTLSLPPGEQRAKLLLAVGTLSERAVQEFQSPLPQRAQAFLAYSRAEKEAVAVATRTNASGLLGGLYEDEGRNAEALRLTYQAISLAQSINAQDQLYRWEWQAGEIEEKLGKNSQAALSFDRALFTLSGIRSDVLQSSRQAFGLRVEPVYLAYADAHLREAAALAVGGADQQRVLRDVRDKLESLKQAEVQDYFDNSCAVSAAVGNDRGTNIPGAAIVYPILLSDRTEVLIETGGQLRRFSSPVSRGELTATVRKLRIGIERPNAGDQYRQSAQALYKWLFADAAPWLAGQKVNTLVFVPSGPLRTVPLAVLLDGSQFLIERYAIATTPAITLIPTLVTPTTNRVLIAGLTKSVQGFAALPGVNTEIRDIGAIFPNQSLEDETFSLSSIRKDLSEPNFSVAHLATHGEFSADHRQSFILTYDSRLTMDGLQTALGRREDPLDLLVLSACSTAAGDDRAALGLAGVAIQSGAKSALASLWSISDEATSSLMVSFYKSRKAGGETKAQSLRDAQLALLRSPTYSHPSYWAPYLLIGNWL